VADALAAHQFNSQNPLSATAFQAWRARLLAKHDVITRSSESLVIIHTIAAEGSLHEAEIALNPATNTATALKLTFDDFAVDIREMAGWHPSTPSTIPTASTTPGVPVPPAPDLALDRDIKRARAGLSSAPRLLLVPSWNIRTRPSYLWDSDIRERERYAVEMLPVFAAIEQRLAVLDDLAKTYPAREVDDWSPARRVKLRTLVTTHYGAVSAALDDLHNRWHSILGPQDRATPRDPFTPDWQQNVVPQRRQARDLSRLANQVLMNLPRAANESKQAELEGGESAIHALWNVIYHATTKISPRCDVPPR
jgi:hypothetical protein